MLPKIRFALLAAAIRRTGGSIAESGETIGLKRWTAAKIAREFRIRPEVRRRRRGSGKAKQPV